MPFTGDSFSHLFDWEKDPQRQEKIINARLEAEFDGIDAAITALGSTNRVVNGKVTESHAASAVTYALKTLSGADPSSSDPVFVTLPDGTTDAVTSAVSVTVSSGSTLGVTSSVPFRVWHTLIYDAGTWRLGVRQCTSANDISGFPGNGLLSSTAEGGAGAADSAGVTYTGTAVTAKPFLIVGFSEYDSGLGTAGTWGTAPDRIPLWSPGMPRPGDHIGTFSARHATSESTASTSYTDTSLTKAIVPTSACNPVIVEYTATTGQSTASKYAMYIVRRGGTPIGDAKGIFNAGGIFVNSISDIVFDRPGAASSQTYTLGYKTDAFNCTNNMGSMIALTEVMG
jgi:hypothetical protein